MWYGLKIGLSYEAVFSIPMGELLDLIAVEQVKHEGAKLVNDADFWALLERK